MPKPRKTFRCRIPAYKAPRLEWRRLMKQELDEARLRQNVSYKHGELVEVSVRLYMAGRETEFHDIDNRLKDIFDTLQGRMGGPKSRKPKSPLIHNDSQIWRVVAVKCKPPKQSLGRGHLKIQPFRA